MIQITESADNPTPLFTQGLQIPTADPVIYSFFAFIDSSGYEFMLYNPPADSIIEIRNESEITWTNLMSGSYDLSPYAGSKTTFYVRETPDTPRVNSTETYEIRAQPNADL